jgi:hypothetical protein
MRVWVELPPEWGPGQVIITAWERAGYRVDDVRSLGTGERRLIVHGGFCRGCGGAPADDETPDGHPYDRRTSPPAGGREAPG